MIGSWWDRLRRAWESTRHDDLEPGCVVLDGPTTDDEHLVWHVLFARAFALPAGRRRERKVLQLAAAYRALFPPAAPDFIERPDEGTDVPFDQDQQGYPGGDAT